jgi:hypothetical protein
LEKATGVNKSGLYSEFKNKGELYFASGKQRRVGQAARKVRNQSQ